MKNTTAAPATTPTTASTSTPAPASAKVTMASLPDKEIFLYSTHLPNPSSLLKS